MPASDAESLYADVLYPLEARETWLRAVVFLNADAVVDEKKLRRISCES
jgi:hypothetical protein